MPLGPRIPALRALGHRTSDSDSTSWPTPTSTDANTGVGQTKDDKGPNATGGTTLPGAAHLAPWPTPTAVELGNTLENYQAMKANMKSGPRAAITHLSLATQLIAGWPTPTSEDSEATGSRPARDGKSESHTLNSAAKLPVVGWTTPQAHDASPRGKGQKPKHGTAHGCADLNADVAKLPMVGWETPKASDGNGARKDDGKRGLGLNTQAGWATPNARDYKSESAKPETQQGWFEHSRGKNLSKEVLLTTESWATPVAADARGSAGVGKPELPNQVLELSGTTPDGSTAETTSGAASHLNPRFSLWLQGLPDVWAFCAERAMRSVRPKPKRSSKRTSPSESE